MATRQDEAIQLGIALGALIIIIEIAFFKGSIVTNLRMALSLFLLFMLPGYLLLDFLREKLESIERIVAGTLLSGAIFIVVAYYAGLLGLHVRTATILVPLLQYLIAGALILHPHAKKTRHPNH